MPIRFNSDRRVQLPPAELIPIPAVREAAEAWEAAQQARRAATQSVEQLERERAQAVEKDRQALADALQAGKADPGTPYADAHDAKLDEAKRHADARRIVTERALAALNEAFAEHEHELHERAREDVEARTATFLDSLDVAQSRKNEVQQAKALLSFYEGRRYNPNADGGAVPVRFSGSHTMGANSMFDHLRDWADPPKPRSVLRISDAANAA